MEQTKSKKLKTETGQFMKMQEDEKEIQMYLFI